MSRTAKIELGGHAFTARPLTLGDAEDLADAIDQFSTGRMREKISAARAILLAAWKRADSTASDDSIRAIEANPGDLFASAIAVLRLSGYIKESAGKAAAAPETAVAAA